jgi:hypothetical protein
MTKPLPPGWRRIRLGDLLEQVNRFEPVRPDREYCLLGVRWYANGCHLHTETLGHALKTRSHFKTCPLEYHNAMNCQATVGGSLWRGEDSPHNNGKLSASISRSHRCHHGVDARALMIAAVWRASSGSSGPAPNGASCRGGMGAPVPAGADSRSGKRPGCCSNSGGPSWPSSMTSRSCAGMNALRMAASFRRKKGS